MTERFVLYGLATLLVVYVALALKVLAAWLKGRRKEGYTWNGSTALERWMCWVEFRYDFVTNDAIDPERNLRIAANPVLVPASEAILVLDQLVDYYLRKRGHKSVW